MCGVFITESVQATKKKKEKKIRWQVAGGRWQVRGFWKQRVGWDLESSGNERLHNVGFNIGPSKRKQTERRKGKEERGNKERRAD